MRKRHLKLVALYDLKIEVGKLELEAADKTVLTSLVDQITVLVTGGTVIKQFWSKIGIVKDLVKRIRSG